MLPELETAWRQEGPAFLQAAQQATGRPFAFREAKAALITCGLSSMSHPLLINMKRQIHAAELNPAPAPRRFVGVVFHEVLHRYVSDTLGNDSTPLLRKYAGEPALVRNHLHLFAIREAAYARRGRSSELQEVQSFEGSSPFAASFERAREIVLSEGVERFVKELQREE